MDKIGQQINNKAKKQQNTNKITDTPQHQPTSQSAHKSTLQIAKKAENTGCKSWFTFQYHHTLPHINYTQVHGMKKWECLSKFTVE